MHSVHSVQSAILYLMEFMCSIVYFVQFYVLTRVLLAAISQCLEIPIHRTDMLR